jgi:hypothetical protein
MNIMQYEITLPADYDMGIIRNRVATRGNATDAELDSNRPCRTLVGEFSSCPISCVSSPPMGEGCRRRTPPAGPRGFHRARARPSPGRSRCSSRAFSHALTNSSPRKSPSTSKARNLSSRRFVLRDHDEGHGCMVHNTPQARPLPRGRALPVGGAYGRPRCPRHRLRIASPAIRVCCSVGRRWGAPAKRGMNGRKPPRDSWLPSPWLARRFSREALLARV